jgi:precorrin isomerase
MRHRKWISALDLEKWADQSDAQTRPPELIRRLMHATVDPSNLEHVSFSGGKETHRPDYDGETKVRSGRGNAKAPDGVVDCILVVSRAICKN